MRREDLHDTVVNNSEHSKEMHLYIYWTKKWLFFRGPEVEKQIWNSDYKHHSQILIFYRVHCLYGNNGQIFQNSVVELHAPFRRKWLYKVLLLPWYWKKENISYLDEENLRGSKDTKQIRRGSLLGFRKFTNHNIQIQYFYGYI